MFSIVSNLQAHYHSKLDPQKVDQHKGITAPTLREQSVAKPGTPLLNILVEKLSMT